MIVWGCLRSFLAEINFFEIVAPSGSGSEVLCFRKPPKLQKITENRENRKIGVRKITFSTLSRCRIDLEMVPGCSPELFTPRKDDISKSRFFGFFLSFHVFGPFFHLKRWFLTQMSGVPKGATKKKNSPKITENPKKTPILRRVRPSTSILDPYRKIYMWPLSPPQKKNHQICFFNGGLD